MGGPITTSTEEDYLKVIYQLSEHARSQVSTSSVAQHIKTSAASVTDMLKKLSVKGFIHYEPYKGARLSPAGQRLATILVRKHRLWETFLVQKLDFTWDEVHEVAEQLEHIDSDKLVDRLDHFLGYPKYDPHGDPIPNAEGKFTLRDQTILSKVPTGASVVLVGVKSHEEDFLQYLDEQGLGIGTELVVESRMSYDDSLRVTSSDGSSLVLSAKVSNHIYVKTN